MRHCPVARLKTKDPGGEACNCLDLRLQQQWKRTRELWKQHFKQGKIGIQIYGEKCNIYQKNTTKTTKAEKFEIASSLNNNERIKNPIIITKYRKCKQLRNVANVEIIKTQ